MIKHFYLCFGLSIFRSGACAGIALAGLTYSHAGIAQSVITGQVISDDDKAPLAGVSVIEKGTNNGTVSDSNGKYQITVKGASSVLTFSFLGYVSHEVTVGGRAVADVTLFADEKQLAEVVVTALGIKKDVRKLGYAVQELKGESIVTARETNIVNQLAGKVAGVTVVGSPSGIGGSARVTIRGERSVDLNKNQPLYVIDGVPISNSITGGSGQGNLEVDFGNGASFINPDDVETMSVLKGPAAAALYGSRAANGVILITTKSGKGNKGIGVEVNSNTTFERALKLPEYQNKYGQGNGNGGDFAFVNGGGGGLTDGTDEGWGARIQRPELSAIQFAAYVERPGDPLPRRRPQCARRKRDYRNSMGGRCGRFEKLFANGPYVDEQRRIGRQ
jgi:TonB-dependent SusC/RagA subfamily outer membrane receptor